MTPPAEGLWTRPQVEERERKILAPYAMKAGDSRGRAHPEPEHPYRTAFQRDRDRIIHCTAFRRLEYKTQVFVNHQGDYYRTRLTHTMEVAQIARTLARMLGLNEDLTEAIALSHDMGHPPFGHSGQDGLDALLKAVDPDVAPNHFEHNRQSLRIVEELERRYPDFPGLNLSYEVRESIAKHAKGSGGRGIRGIDLASRPLLEAQVVDASDSIAYNNHDIDDGLKAGLITGEQMEEELELWRGALAAVDAAHPGMSQRDRRLAAVRHLIDREVSDVVQEAARRIREAKVQSPDDARACPDALVGFSPGWNRQRRELQAFLHRNLYGHYRIRRMQIKAQRFLGELFRAYYHHPDQLPTEYRAVIEAAPDDLSLRKQQICDYIAGMTDRYAQEEYQKLFHPFERL